MIFVDTHTHLYLEQFDDDRELIVQNAIDKGVKFMLLPNIDQGSFVQMQLLSKQFPKNCLPMIGLHPTSVGENYRDELRFVEQESSTGKYCAVGEIGIDLYWDKTYKEQQEEAFRHQLRLAKQYNLPVSIHTRDAFNEIYNIVAEEKSDNLKGIFHCFTGTIEQAEKIAGLGFLMGIGGVVTFKNSGLDKVLKEIPLNRLVLETDSPFLAPTPFRGKRNESAYTIMIAEKIAEIKEISLEEVAEVTSQNAIRIFNLSNQ